MNEYDLAARAGGILLAGRKEAGLSQKEAAEFLGPSHSAIGGWERGEKLKQLLYVVELAQLASSREGGSPFLEDLLSLLDPDYPDRKKRLAELEAEAQDLREKVIPTLIDQLARSHLQRILQNPEAERARLAKEALERMPGTTDPRLLKRMYRSHGRPSLALLLERWLEEPGEPEERLAQRAEKAARQFGERVAKAASDVLPGVLGPAPTPGAANDDRAPRRGDEPS